MMKVEMVGLMRELRQMAKQRQNLVDERITTPAGRLRA
jgi:hypothetical protein